MTRYLPVFCVLACAVVVVPAGTQAQVPVPSDVKQTCVVSPDTFKKWFGGTVKENGLVSPANSVGFTLDPTNPHCSFYQWSEQMFLWATSPVGGGGGHVFNSPIFFDVNPATGAITANAANQPLRLGVRDLQPGPRGKRLRLKGGAVIEDETGQAGGGGTLMAQNGSLIYYAVHVNDMYAYFKTGANESAFTPPPVQFPTTPAERDMIVAFAASLGITIPDADALTIEIKTSWIEASSVDASKYVTATATIPTFDFSKAPVTIPGSAASGWHQSGVKTTTMALIGMHVVGPVKGHPEMVWASFEHAENAPNNTYQYTAADGSTKTVPYTPAPPPGVKNWLLCASNANPDPTKLNQEILKTSASPLPPGWIVQNQKATSNASDTVRLNPWGVAAGAAGLADATAILSVNNSVMSQLLGNDVRKNYVMIGAVWTGGLVPPSQSPIPDRAKSIGSTLLANATMETYNQQFSCFDCHNGNALGVPKAQGGGGLSHIWGDLESLPTTPRPKK